MSSQEKIFYFDMGQKELPENLSLTALYQEIHEEICYKSCDKRESDRCKEEDCKKQASVDAIKQRIESNQKGSTDLRKIAANFFNIDLYINSDDSDNVKFQKLKLLKLLYYFERFKSKESPKFCISNIVKKPSIEYFDNLINLNNKHGRKVREIKQKLLTEIPNEFNEDAIFTISSVLKHWDNRIAIIRSQIMNHANSDNEENFAENLKELVANLKDSEKDTEFLKNQTDSEHSLMEEFYLKILLSEFRGREFDIIKVHTNIQLDNIENAAYIQDMRLIISNKVQLYDVDRYIKKNIGYVSKLIYKKEVLDPKIHNKVKSYVKYAKIALEILIEYGWLDTEKGVLLPHIIAAMQEVLLEHDNVSYKYYQRSSEHPTLLSKLKYIDKIKSGKIKEHQKQYVDEFYKQLIFQRIVYRFMDNIGLHNQIQLLLEIEKQIDEIILRIFDQKGLLNILRAHKRCIEYADRSLLSDRYILSFLGLIRAKLLVATGYSLEVENQEITENIKLSVLMHIDKVTDAFVEALKKTNHNSSNKQLLTFPNGACLNLNINPEKKEILLLEQKNL